MTGRYEMMGAVLGVGGTGRRVGRRLERGLRAGAAQLLRPPVRPTPDSLTGPRTGAAQLLRPPVRAAPHSLIGSDAGARVTSVAVAPASRTPAGPWTEASVRWRPVIVGDELIQPSDTTCGPSSLVMARLINDTAYRSGLAAGVGTVDRAAFVDAVRRTHRRTSGPRDQSGRWQVPWLTLLGTTPWAAARAMSGADGAGRGGRRHRVVVIDPTNVGEGLRAIVAAVAEGDVVPLFVGSTLMARHVVLVTDATDTSLSLYDPASGGWYDVDQQDCIDRTAVIAGWTEPWFAVVAVGPSASVRR